MKNYTYSILEDNKNSPSLIFYYHADESELDFLEKELKNMREENKNKKFRTYNIVRREKQQSCNYIIIK
jgi:hypothetical protein